MSFPSRMTCPPSAFRRPARTSANSCCPLPDTPAMPKISPSRTVKEAFLSDQPLVAEARTGPSPRGSASPASTSALSTRKITSRPTISLARLLSVRCPVSSRAVTLPCRRTVTLSLMASTMGSLWVMKGHRWPVHPRSWPRSTARSFSVSGGVKRGGRLVQDQDLGPAVEGLEDLYHLFFTL